MEGGRGAPREPRASGQAPSPQKQGGAHAGSPGLNGAAAGSPQRPSGGATASPSQRTGPRQHGAKEPRAADAALRSELDAVTTEAMRRELERFAQEALRRELDRVKESMLSELRSLPVGPPVRAWAAAGESSPQAFVPVSKQTRELSLSQAWDDSREEQAPLLQEPCAEGSDSDEEAKQLQSQRSWRRRVSLFVRDPKFETAINGVILMSVVELCVQTQYMAQHWLKEPPQVFKDIETVFCIVFVAEMVLKLISFGYHGFFCCRKNWMSNLFDFSLVVFQFVDIAVDMLGSSNSNRSRLAGVLRFFRIVRLMRLVRFLRMVPELRTLLVSIFTSMKALFWTFTVVFLVSAVFGVVLTLIVTDYKVSQFSPEDSSKEKEMLEKAFGSVSDTMLTLYGTVSGGRDWTTQSEPLRDQIDDNLVYVFVLYTFFVIFAIMNVITSHFVDTAIEASAADKRETMVLNLMETFSTASKHITKESFIMHADQPSMQKFLNHLFGRDGVTREDVLDSQLFEILDDDSSGWIDKKEVVQGILKLAGNATALDLATLRLDVISLLGSMRFLMDQLSKNNQLQKHVEGVPTFHHRRHSFKALHDGRGSDRLKENQASASA